MNRRKNLIVARRLRALETSRAPLTATVIALALLLLVPGTRAMQVAPVDRATQVAPIDKVLADAVARGDVPGVVAMAADRRGVVYQGAFGMADTAAGRRLAVDSIFRIASMTKPVTSVALMQLVDERRIGLDDPAAKYLPELARIPVLESFDAKTGGYTVRPAKTAVTVRHLLAHSSGLGYNFTSPIVRDFKPRSGESYPAGVLLFEPGEQWLYGTSTDWVGRLVESISGKPIAQYFEERIFGPLRMTDTFYSVPDEKQARVVAVHRRRADGTFAPEPVQLPLRNPQPIGGGGLHSTAADYTRFVRMFLNGGTLDGARILSAESAASMGRNHLGTVKVRALKTAMPERSSDFSFVADGRDTWGLGFLITATQRSGLRSAGSLSWGGINNTYFWIDPSRGVAGVILMQFLPFADTRALSVYQAFEREVYRVRGAS